MNRTEHIESELDEIRNNLRFLIEKFLNDEIASLEQWTAHLQANTDNDCWKRNSCTEKSCPAFKNKKCRCWLVAGTMCRGEYQGVFAKKYRSCMECTVYQNAVFSDPVTEIEEHLIVLIHTLICKQEQINALATIDHLTGLHNRRSFDILIETELSVMERNDGQIYLTLIDLDDFKKINDVYGHSAGDEMLKSCAQILSDSTRKSDILVRYGGDEFLIAASCPSSNLDAAEIIEKRILDKLRVWNKKNAAAGVELSFSIGHSVLKKGESLEAAIREADLRMYENKRRKLLDRSHKRKKQTR